jgi:hypothetical protein
MGSSFGANTFEKRRSSVGLVASAFPFLVQELYCCAKMHAKMQSYSTPISTHSNTKDDSSTDSSEEGVWHDVCGST